jgi:hypothetical protein
MNPTRARPGGRWSRWDRAAQVRRGLQVPLVHKDHRDLRVFRARKGRQERRVRKVQPARLVHKDLRSLSRGRGRQAELTTRATSSSLMAPRISRSSVRTSTTNRIRRPHSGHCSLSKARPAQRVLPAQPEHKARKAQAARKVQRGLPVLPARPAQRARWEQPERPAPQDRRERPVRKVLRFLSKVLTRRHTRMRSET